MDSFLKSLGISFHNMGGCYGIDKWIGSGQSITSINPTTGERIAEVKLVTKTEYDVIKKASLKAFESWRHLPAPKRGDIIRDIGDGLKENKKNLGKLVTIETGKIIEEGKGEIQEAIDMAYYASGLSRQPYGKIISSERSHHTIQEHWHPLGTIGIITSFNFPAAVWSWNTFIAAICGNTTIWKPSTKTPLCAIALQHIVNDVLFENEWDGGIACLCCGKGSEVGEWLTNDPDIPLISATGSVTMGKKVATTVSQRMGKTILELGGNNAAIVTPDADLNLAIKAIVFGAVGTAGQRCTSTRRVIVHESIKDEVIAKLIGAYKSLRIGNPLECDSTMGPLIDLKAVQEMMNALESVREQGGTILYGGKHMENNFVEPAIVEVPGNVDIVKQETFAPILYIMGYETPQEAIYLLRDVPQGLSSSIFTNNLHDIECFLSTHGSDCGIANVNVGTSGAEIGGAFGGEKETGGGREAGSDAWKAYMRRQTVTINWGKKLPLSQGINFSY